MSSMKGMLVALSLAGASLGFANSSHAGVASGAAIDPAVAETTEQPMLDKVWCNGWGCGPGWRGPGWGWRGPGWGYRPWGWGGPAYVRPIPRGYWGCPPGYHIGPYGRACWPD
jgi:hypothetical protein